MGEFLGHQLKLTISTDWTVDRTQPLPVSEAELSLAELILTNLPAILTQAESRFLEHEQKASSREQHARDPTVWIDRDGLVEDGPLRWALVVHHDEWPDFGWHIEFDGSQCIAVWAGS